MKPNDTQRDEMDGIGQRRQFLKLAAAGLGVASLAGTGGCSALNVRSQSPDTPESEGPQTQLVGDLAVAFGMYPVKVEAVGLVANLAGTGSDPEPSPQRAELLAEMQTRGVNFPNQVLASPTTSLVFVRGYLRPGIQKGDKFDVEVRVPNRNETTSLRGGWLMETRLKELAVLNNQVREGKLLGMAEGAVLVDPSAKGEHDKVKLCRGRVLGGGIALESRQLGLVIKPEQQNIRNSALIGTAVNRRFHLFEHGIKTGTSNPQTNKFIELTVHPRYKDNIERYMRVVRSVPLRETSSQQLERIKLLERQLLDPITAASASLKLEAIGKDGIPPLRKGIEAKELEVRFYAAEALAYLDSSEAALPLAQAAREEPAFRAFALAALSAMDDVAAYEALRGLLDVTSAETRYGAFRALWAMNERDSLVKGETLGEQFSYHVLDVGGPPMLHVTRSYRPEIVLFGQGQRFSAPFVLDAGTIMIKAQDDERVTVSRFSVGEPDQKRVVSTLVDDVIRAVVDLGGTYPDVVQALAQAKGSGALTSRFEIDALPQGGRTYDRDPTAGDEGTLDGKPAVVPSNPMPDLFGRKTGGPEAEPKPAKISEAKTEDKKPGAFAALFGKKSTKN